MDNPTDKIIERVYVQPSNSQVTKAVKQYLADEGVAGARLEKIVTEAVERSVAAKISALMNSDRFDKLIAAAVAHTILQEKRAFDNTSYGLQGHIRDLMKQELSRLLLRDYEVKVVKKGE